MRRISAVTPMLLLLVLFLLALCSNSAAQVNISVSFGPPPLPVYEQPICPGEGYMWVPGYWAWDDDYDDYYWVPGTWVLAPEPGYLWTPPWWGWDNGVYVFHQGWWGPVVGFYGGIDYGYGYPGEGYYGGRWEHDHFYYNRSVTNVNVTEIHNVYNETVVNRNVTVNHVSYNGGPGGIEARPRPEDQRAAQERHLPPVAAQTQHVQTARTDPQLRASANHGRPPVAATPKPTEFRGGGVVPARSAGGEYHPPANRGGGNRGGTAPTPENRPAQPQPENRGSRPAVHPNELPPVQRPAPPNTGNPNRDQKYQQQQQKMFERQQQQRQQLQQRQDQEHQRIQQRNPNQMQQLEQRHQQQTQQLQQRQQQQQQHMEQQQENRKR
jgi:hypothetical protein